MTDFTETRNEWEVVPIDDLAFVASGGSAPQGDHYFSGNNPFVRVQHIEQDADRITEWNLITDQAVHDYGLRLFPKGTIVFPKSGASIYLEKRAVLPIDAYIVSHLCALSPKTEIAIRTLWRYKARCPLFLDFSHMVLSVTKIKRRRVLKRLPTD